MNEDPALRRYSSRKFWFAILLAAIAGLFVYKDIDIVQWTSFSLILYGAYCGANVMEKVKMNGK
jgi:hypothetical protein